jgi:Zn-dependent peptidase ImmA (M78 family)/DNA-binding XRE family transcriptional regulator
VNSDRADIAVALFAGGRLRTARLARKHTVAELATAIGVTAAAISQYENGHSRPTRTNLVKLAMALRFPIEFFGTSGEGELEGTQAFFRSLRRTKARERDAADAKALLVGALVDAYDALVDLPRVDVPRILLLDAEARGPEAAEHAARRVRELWELGDSPIPHVTRLLESKGIVVIKSLEESDDVDAFSRWLNGRPVVVLTEAKGCIARSRFNAAHELGHLVMHQAAEAGDTSIEGEAHRFAAELLMPAKVLVRELPTRADWPALVRLKHKWGVSIQALLYRARELGRLSDHAYRRAITDLNRRGWARDEPAPLTTVETPIALSKATELLSQHGVPLEEIAKRARLPFDLVSELMPSLPARPRVQVEVAL